MIGLQQIALIILLGLPLALVYIGLKYLVRLVIKRLKMKAIISGLVLLGIVCGFLYLFPILLETPLLVFVIFGLLMCLELFFVFIDYLISNVIEGLK